MIERKSTNEQADVAIKAVSDARDRGRDAKYVHVSLESLTTDYATAVVEVEVELDGQLLNELGELISEVSS